MGNDLKEMLKTPAGMIYSFPTYAINHYKEIMGEKESLPIQKADKIKFIAETTLAGFAIGFVYHGLGITGTLCVVGLVYNFINPEFGKIPFDSNALWGVEAFMFAPIVTNMLSGACELVRNRKIGLENKLNSTEDLMGAK